MMHACSVHDSVIKADNDLLVQSRTFAETRFASFTIRVRDDVFNDITSTGNVHCGILVWSREAGLPYLRYDCVVSGILDEKEIIKRERIPGNVLYLVSPLPITNKMSVIYDCCGVQRQLVSIHR